MRRRRCTSRNRRRHRMWWRAPPDTATGATTAQHQPSTATRPRNAPGVWMRAAAARDARPLSARGRPPRPHRTSILPGDYTPIRQCGTALHSGARNYGGRSPRPNVMANIAPAFAWGVREKFRPRKWSAHQTPTVCQTARPLRENGSLCRRENVARRRRARTPSTSSSYRGRVRRSGARSRRSTSARPRTRLKTASRSTGLEGSSRRPSRTSSASGCAWIWWKGSVRSRRGRRRKRRRRRLPKRWREEGTWCSGGDRLMARSERTSERDADTTRGPRALREAGTSLAQVRDNFARSPLWRDGKWPTTPGGRLLPPGRLFFW